MVGINDVPINRLIERTAESLKADNLIKPPEWSAYVKTGMHKERPPISNDWWYSRAAAILKSIEKLGPIGVSKLRTKYGGRKNRGHKPDKFYRGSGSIIRKVLQQLEAAKLIEQRQIGLHKGRVLTGKGKAYLAKAAKELSQVAKKHTELAVKKEQPVALVAEVKK